MSTVYSMTGAAAGRDTNWAWCVPGIGSGDKVPIVVLHMSPDGLKYVPTSVLPPAELRPQATEYREVKPTSADLELQEAVFRWAQLDEKKRNLDDGARAVLLANNVCAAMRFLSARSASYLNVGRPIREEHLYLGRSLLVQETSEARPSQGWLASAVEPFDVVVLSQASGRFERFVIPTECLEEDGTAWAIKSL